MTSLSEVKIISESDLADFTKNNEACLIYFSHDNCNVCKDLKPKIKLFVEDEFDKMKFGYVDVLNNKELAAQKFIFSVPTIIVFFTNREMFRYSRYFSIDELRSKLERPYGMIFD